MAKQERITIVKSIKISSLKFLKFLECLGAMTHFIADMASPAHVVDVQHDDSWEDYIMRITKLTTTDSDWFNGGPDWSVIDPNLIMIDSGKSLHPMKPISAAKEMALYTYAAIDLYGPAVGEDVEDFSGRPLAAGSESFPFNGVKISQPLNHGLAKSRVQTLVGLAAYYSACALISTLEKCNVKNQDTLSDRRDYHPEEAINDFSLVPHVVPECAEDLAIEKAKLMAYRQGNTRPPVSQQNLALMTAALIPMLALLIIPAAFKVGIAKTKNLLGQETESYS